MRVPGHIHTQCVDGGRTYRPWLQILFRVLVIWTIVLPSQSPWKWEVAWPSLWPGLGSYWPSLATSWQWGPWGSPSALMRCQVVVAELPGESMPSWCVHLHPLTPSTQGLRPNERWRHISSPPLGLPGLKENPSPSWFYHMWLVSHRSIYKEENVTWNIVVKIMKTTPR